MKRCDKKRSRQSKGFTIVEILAVVVILGILAGVAVPMVYRYVDKSKKQSYETMESTVYAGAKNYVLEQNMSLNSCASGYTDIETIGDNFLQDLQYVERLVDPNDKSKQCVYNVYGCEETEAAGDALATYKYKIELKCLDYTGCIVFHEDGTRVDCEMPNDETRGPDCGEQTPSINSWSNVDKLDIKLQCVDTTSGGCEKKVYTYTFTEEKAHQDVVIKDVFGNSTTCSINTYIDRTAPSKPVIDNPYENVWANKNYKIKVSSVDSLSGIKYFEYRYPNSSNEAERNWTQWENSSKSKGDSTPFTTTDFSIERNEVVEIRACDYAGNCSESSQSMIKIDKTKPTCTIVKNIANPNGSNGWYVSDINVSLDTSDVGGSAIAGYDLTTSTTPTYAFNKTASQGETSGVTYYGYVKDNANNVGTCSSGVIKVDKTPPSLTFSLSGNVSTATCSDSLSSVTQEKYTKNLSSSSLVHSVTCTNGAGLTSSNSKTYKYNACITGSPNECVGSYVRKWVGNATKTASGSCLCRGANTGHGYPAATGWCTTSGCGCPGDTWVIQNNCSIKYSCSSGTLSGSSCYSTVWDSCATTTNTCVAGYTG
ncbi:MAG: type II secretion system protein [bacterium]|nr:type II secretion system protein [bacterium]